MDGLHTSLDRDMFMASEGGHDSSINAVTDASCRIIVSKIRA
jgi:hypothetical protein